MHYSTSEESEGNGGSDDSVPVLAAWDEAHPDITLNQNVLTRKRRVQDPDRNTGSSR